MGLGHPQERQDLGREMTKMRVSKQSLLPRLKLTAILGVRGPCGPVLQTGQYALGELRSGIRWSAGGQVRQEPGPGAAGLGVPAHDCAQERTWSALGALKGWGLVGNQVWGSRGYRSPKLYPSLTGPHPRQLPCVGQAGVGSECRGLVRSLPHILGLHWLSPSPILPGPYPSQGPPQSL